ncbi:hypothetical protein ma178 [Moumouvirus australiensis]|uniref:Uncharacterized protein n=1 Tax=Moumouvirus australiensis TaxID=2109587 RepID=A0A2P1EL28_9VIRU|nr:hypothetical protein QKC55_gp726 [Moumouvirus australiensis]AVL94564.1 hypothetical protein ma178 [Moumouvirus australiensis]
MAYNYTINLNINIDVFEIYNVIHDMKKLDSEWLMYLSSKQFKNSVGINIKNNSMIINCRIFNNRLNLISSKQFDFGNVIQKLFEKFKIFKTDINNIEAKYISFDTVDKKYTETIILSPIL